MIFTERRGLLRAPSGTRDHTLSHMMISPEKGSLVPSASGASQFDTCFVGAPCVRLPLHRGFVSPSGAPRLSMNRLKKKKKLETSIKKFFSSNLKNSNYATRSTCSPAISIVLPPSNDFPILYYRHTHSYIAYIVVQRKHI